MSYKNPLIIQNNPGGNIGQAANQAANSIQNAILFRIEDQERKEKERAEKKLAADALEIEQTKLIATENAAARQLMNSTAYSNNMEAAFSAGLETKNANQIKANDITVDLVDRKIAIQNVANEDQFQQNMIGVNAALGEDKKLYDKDKLDGKSMYFNGDMGKAYGQFMDGNPDYKMTGKRVGLNWTQTIINEKTGESFELPVDKIKDGTWDAYIDTPDIYKGLKDQAKEYNTAINQRLNARGEWQEQDFEKANVLIGNDIMKAQADFNSYLKNNQLGAEAFLENTLMIEKSKLADFGGTNEGLMKALTSGVNDKQKAAMALVNNEIRDDIESTWLSTNGIYREADGDAFKVKKFEAPVVTTKSGGGSTAKYAQDDNTLIATSLSLDPKKYPIENEETFYRAFASKYPVPQVYNGNEVIDLVSKPGGFVIKTKQLKDKATVKQVDRDDLNAQTTKMYPDKTFSELNQEEVGKVRTAAEEANQMAAFMSNGSDEFEEVESPLFRYTNSTHMRKYMEATVAKGGTHSLNGIKTSAENIGAFYLSVPKQNKSE